MHTEIFGPKRVRLFFSTIRFLARHKAESHQYLSIEHRNGEVEHVHGPISMYENPALHDNISVKDSVFLESKSEFIVVHNDGYDSRSVKHVDIESSKVAPHVSTVQGPLRFFPSPNEHIHNFTWSSIKKEKLQAGGSTFQQLRSCSTPLGIVLNVMLSNRHSIQTKLHIEYKVATSTPDVLFRQKDPIARMHNAVMIDGQSLGNTMTVDTVREWQQSELSDIFGNLDSFPTLKKTAIDSGLEILSIRLTGHSLSDELKYSLSTESVLAEKIQSEIKAKTQRRELKALEQEEERKEIEVKAQLKRMKLEADDQLDKEMHEVKLAALKRRAELEVLEEKTSIERTRMKQDTALQFLEKIKDLDVDMTKFLASTKGSEYSKMYKRGTFTIVPTCTEDFQEQA